MSMVLALTVAKGRVIEVKKTELMEGRKMTRKQ